MNRIKPINLSRYNIDAFDEKVIGNVLHFDTSSIDSLRKRFPDLNFAYTKYAFDAFYHVTIDIVKFVDAIMSENIHLKFLLQNGKT